MLNISGQEYKVIKSTKVGDRTLLKLQKPKGKVFYSCTVYENGTYSSVV